MMNELDELDKALPDRVNETQGLPVIEVIRPFLLKKSGSALRERIRALELRQLIRLEKTKREVLCFSEKIESSGAFPSIQR